MRDQTFCTEGFVILPMMVSECLWSITVASGAEILTLVVLGAGGCSRAIALPFSAEEILLCISKGIEAEWLISKRLWSLKSMSESVVSTVESKLMSSNHWIRSKGL